MKKYLIISSVSLATLLFLNVNTKGQVPFPGGGGSGGGAAGIAPWLTLANPVPVSFAWRNQGTASVNAPCWCLK